MNNDRRKGDRRVSPAIGDFALEEREALLARIAELERFEFAYSEWHDKTEWVQAEVSAGVIGGSALGRHRADVMTGLVTELRAELAALKARLSAVRPLGKSVLQRFSDAGLVEYVAIVEYTGYEPANSLTWINKGLAYMEPGTKLYAVNPREFVAPMAEVLAVDELIPDDGRDV